MDHLSSENLFSEMEVDDAAFVNEWMDTLENFAHFCPNDSFFAPASTDNYGTENSDGGVIRKPPEMKSVQCQPSASSSSNGFISFASPLTAVSCNPNGGGENPEAPVVVKMKMKTEMDHREPSGKTMISFMPSSQDYYCSGRGNDEHRESLILRTIEFGPAEKGKRGSAIRSPLQAQDHVLAERKRREKLTQRFISLSALIPGLKKLDKASVLGDAIKYIKELQERVRTLEVDQEQTKRLENEELKKERVSGHDEDSSSLSDDDGSCETGTAVALPEIEVRASGENMLIRVHFNKVHNQGGVIKEIFSKIERLHLTINTSHVMPFGNTTYMTIAAQMDHHFSMEAKDVADNIRSTILKLICHGE